MAATIRLERKSKCCRLCNDGKIIADLKSPVRGFFFIREKGMIGSRRKAGERRRESE
jgi:hypothetical protein